MASTWIGAANGSTSAAAILKPGGAFFLYNIPRWNIELGHHLNKRGMQFRHWITVSIKFGLPIQGRLYPAHYSLLYYTKGKPKTFRKIRTPIETCRHCGGEIKDYGGHRDAMNDLGVNLMDVWTDIPPVRHGKFKSSKRKANALSTKILDRVVEMTHARRRGRARSVRRQRHDLRRLRAEEPPMARHRDRGDRRYHRAAIRP